MTWSVTIEKGRGSERTGVRSVRTLVVVSPESLETAGGAQKTQALPFRISIHPEAYTCIPVIYRSPSLLPELGSGMTHGQGI